MAENYAPEFSAKEFDEVSQSGTTTENGVETVTVVAKKPFNWAPIVIFVSIGILAYVFGSEKR